VHNEPSAEFVAKHTCPELTDFIGIANRYGKGGGMLYVIAASSCPPYDRIDRRELQRFGG
jgi:hypothetical protein